MINALSVTSRLPVSDIRFLSDRIAKLIYEIPHYITFSVLLAINFNYWQLYLIIDSRLADEGDAF